MPSRSIGSAWFVLGFGAIVFGVSGCVPGEPGVALDDEDGAVDVENTPDPPLFDDHHRCHVVDPGASPEGLVGGLDTADPKVGRECPDETLENGLSPERAPAP